MNVRDLLKNPSIAGTAGFVLGLIIGLFVLGWWLWPVEWTDAGPVDLRPDAREDYLRMAIDSFAVNGNNALARARWEALGETAEDTLAAIEANPGSQNPTAIETFKTAVGAAAPVGPQEEAGGGPPWLLILACFVTALLAVGLLVMYLSRQTGGGEITPAMQAAEFTREMERTDYAALGEEPPLTQFVTTYMLGDDLFDDSFSIDSPAGEFLGECGVGISETIGAADPKRVTAFEVWLFDKNDIQTVTKVIMSPHAFRDAGLRERLSAKGEPVMASVDAPVMLETKTLRMTARIADMGTGGPPLPEDSHFERLTLELAIWQK